MTGSTRGALTCAALVAAGSSGFGQFYHPDRIDYGTPARSGLRYEPVSFRSRDGTKLHGWFVPAAGKALGTVIHFHGNAQNMSAHFSYVSWLPRHGFNVLAFDYRGYGQSEGAPTRRGVHQDAIAALQYIRMREDIEQDRLLILGQSLGGAVAITALAGRDMTGIRGIAVESTFDSYLEIAKAKAPDMVARIFVSDGLSPKPVVAELSPAPILFIHGTADRVVPYARGKALFDAAKEPKELWTVQGGRHTEAFTRYGTIYQPRLVAFFKECLESGRGK